MTMLYSGGWIRLTKLSEKTTPEALFKGYTMKGWLINDVQVGNMIQLFRTERNGITINGIANTSLVKTLEPLSSTSWLVTTENSQFRLELEEPDEDFQRRNNAGQSDL